MQSPPIRRALISVSDKTGLAEFARSLSNAGIEIISTGGTRRYLEEHLIAVKDISEYTGFPEMMDGRLKTLHPKVFGGILCRHDRSDDMQAIAAHDIRPFELIVVNLYPFEETIARPGVTTHEAIEQIDIGGPSLVRAAAKNHAFVTIATSSVQYAEIAEEIRLYGATTINLRTRLAGEAFARTADYDRAIATYFTSHAAAEDRQFPSSTSLVLRKKMNLRYGENPHQQAALYQQVGWSGHSVVDARQLHGKELSYNNYLDLDSAFSLVRMFEMPAAAVIKHTNPCGCAVADRLADALLRALEGDPQSAFGSVLALNRTVDVDTAQILAQPGLFVEAIIAPDFEAAAVGVLTTKPKWKDNVRLMQVGRIEEPRSDIHYRHISGGMLLQEMDDLPDIPSSWQVVTTKAPPADMQHDLEFGWTVVRHLKSNAIAVCRDGALWGAGAGQMSRVDSVEIALQKAGARVAGSILASDAFFPFPDSIEKAADAGVRAIIQPGGSRRDDEVIAACNARGIPMVFTGRRHFKH